MTDITAKHVAILVDNYFEESEFTTPKEIIRQAGAPITVVSTGAETLWSMHHAEIAGKFMPDLTIDDVHFEDYDMLVLPGGVINADQLRMNQKAREWAEYCVEQDVPMAAICHAPWLLVSAGIIDGLKVTSYHTLQDDIVNAGGDWVDKDVVIDGNIITSRTPADLPVFCAAIIATLERVPIAHA